MQMLRRTLVAATTFCAHRATPSRRLMASSRLRAFLGGESLHAEKPAADDCGTACNLLACDEQGQTEQVLSNSMAASPIMYVMDQQIHLEERMRLRWQERQAQDSALLPDA